MEREFTQTCIFIIAPVVMHTVANQGFRAFEGDLVEAILFVHLYTSPQRRVFFTSFSVYWVGVMFDGCAMRAISDSVSAMTSSVA